MPDKQPRDNGTYEMHLEMHLESANLTAFIIAR